MIPVAIILSDAEKIVKAKDNDLRLGLGQCTAEMVAVHRFNSQRGKADFPIYGVISTGTNWRFYDWNMTHSGSIEANISFFSWIRFWAFSVSRFITLPLLNDALSRSLRLHLKIIANPNRNV